MNHLFSRESALFDPVARYLSRKGFRWQMPELGFYEYRIDLYAFSPNEDLTIAVELKLGKWKRGVEQILLYQLCADLVYLAVPTTILHRVDQSLFTRYGLGLLTVDTPRRCRQIIPGHQSPELRNCYRERSLEMLQGQLACRR